MECCIKSLEWRCKDKSVLKIESISAYLQDELSVEHVPTDLGWLDITISEKSDIQYEKEANKVVLIDNTDYWITYEENSEYFDTVSLVELLVRSLEGKGILNSRNYVGILDIGISDFEIIVKSKKSSYERDFKFLRESISNFCDDLLSRSSSYFSEHFEKSNDYVTDKVNYADIAYLRDMLSPDKFPSWIDYFVHHAEHKYIAEEQEKYISDIDDVDPMAYMDGLLGNQLVRTSKIRGRAGKFGQAPQFVRSVGYTITYDTNENRFVKFFVYFLRDFLQDVLNEISEENIKLHREVGKLHQIVSEKLENPFWKNISHMENLPFNSQVLQKKYPYNLIFQMYTDFSMKSKVSLGSLDKSFLAGQKDTPILYQYWVFIMLFKFLSKKYEERYVASDWIFYDKNGLTFTLEEGRKSFAKFIIDDDTQMDLLYNKTYDSKHVIGAGRSYSHELKPDISLELFKGNELVAIMHLDAKYRLPINGTDVPDDINKMHAYKDGILGTVGAFAVCLADKPIVYHEEEKGWESDGIYPAVGACPLNLNPETLDKELGYIYNLIDEFARIDVDNSARRYSRKHLEKYYALYRKLMKVKE